MSLPYMSEQLGIGFCVGEVVGSAALGNVGERVSLGIGTAVEDVLEDEEV